MRVGFYLENKNIPNIDFSKPEEGNPGCGGTEYLFVALPYYLQKKTNSKITPVIFANETSRLPHDIERMEAESVYDAAYKAKNCGCDYFIYRPRRDAEHDILELIDKIKLPSIAWAHVGLPPHHIRKMSACQNLKAIVCVEKEQHDDMCDSPVWDKLTYIVNGFDVDSFRKGMPTSEKDKNLVIYLGALTMAKGFHVLAKAWPLVVSKRPKAHLAIIGSGSLYNHNQVLGRWGVAESSYEEEYIIPFLSMPDGSPLPSVTFLGKLGVEKKEWLQKALIGVANPTGASENCPGSALEIEASGTAAVSGSYYGMLDTIIHNKTGLLGNTTNDLANNIIQLLDSPETALQMGKEGINFVQHRYNWTKVVQDWELLFSDLNNCRDITVNEPYRNILKHYKILKLANRPIQKILGKIIFWPSINEIKATIRKTLTRVKNI